ncbi:MurR/RpiR family transcriptional regulator [Lapidilactobacillus salsurivasis]
MQSAVIMKIYSLQSSFTVSENEISQFVIKDPEFVITSTITSLAKKIDTSEASINRFCKKIGYKGFNNFKVALAQSNFQREQADQMLIRDSNVIESMSSDYRAMILNSSAMLELDAIDNAVAALKAATVIHIIALYTTSFVANEFSFRLRQLGLNVRIHTEMLDIQLSMQNVTADDLVFLIVPSVASRDVLTFIGMAKDHDADVILLAGNDSTKINDSVDVKLIIPDRMLADHPLLFSNSAMYLFATDILVAQLINSSKVFKKRKLASDTIIDSFQSANSGLFDNY